MTCGSPRTTELTGHSFRDALTAEIPAIRRFAAKLLRLSPEHPETQELVQEVCARALTYEGSFIPKSDSRTGGRRTLGPWLRTLAFHQFLAHQRSKHRDPVRTGSPSEEMIAPEAPSLTRLELNEVLVKLPKVEQQVLLRFHVFGNSLREIALLMALPENTVKSHLHRARQRLVNMYPTEDKQESGKAS